MNNIFKDLEGSQQKHKIMGVMNLTPDSFSDGGLHLDIQKNLETFISFKKQNVAVFDIGAQSTAPMNSAISESVELERFEKYFFPLLSQSEQFYEEDIVFSIDTYRPKVFTQVRDEILNHLPNSQLYWNDVSGVLSSEVFEILKEHKKTSYVYCHNLVKDREQTNDHMNFVANHSTREDLLFDLMNYFTNAGFKFMSSGLQDQVVFDPCFGLAKSYEQNLWLLEVLPKVVQSCHADQKWVVGVSKKSFLQKLGAGEEDIQNIEALRRSEFFHTILLSKWIKRLSKYPITYRLHDPAVFNCALKSTDLF